MIPVKIKSPTRVDLAGGTLDLWPLYNFTKGASTVNLAIDIFTSVEIQNLPDSSIHLISEDLVFSKKYPDLKSCLADDDPSLRLLQAQIEFWKPSSGFKLTTRSESPIGGGLGGSSSLTISLMKAFSKFLNKPALNSKQDVLQMVNSAHNLEAQILNTPTGTQDYFPPILGGLNIITYDIQGIDFETINIDENILRKNFLLVHTGKAHHSGLNNFEVLSAAVRKEKQTMNALYQIKEIAENMVQVFRTEAYSNLPILFKQEYQARVKLAQAFTSPEIEKLNEISLQAGAQAVKICGAGGGGCVLVWVDPPHREGVIQACEKNQFKVLPTKPVKKNEIFYDS